MAIPYIPHDDGLSEILGIARNSLDAQLEREKMIIDEARARQLAERQERENERQHKQQMAQFGLNQMKANYDMQQGEPGGLRYQKTMAQIGQYNSAADENRAQAELYRRRTENPAAFRNPPASARPRVIPLTAAQTKANADAAAMGQPAPYQPTIINPAVNAAPPDYSGALGKTTAYGYANDPTPDSNSSAGIGAWVPDDEAARIRRGEDSPYKLRPGDLAVSRDVESRLRDSGINPGDEVTFDKANGTTHTGRWMDRTADVYKGKQVNGRFDIYSPSGVPQDDGTPVTGFRRGGQAKQPAPQTEPMPVMPPGFEPPPAGTYAPVTSTSPSASAPSPVINRQGPLPMNAPSLQRRAEMESTRIKTESSITISLNQRRDAAKGRLLADPKDDIAAIELQQVEKELRRIITPAKKAEIVPDDAPAAAPATIPLDPSKNVSGQMVPLGNTPDPEPAASPELRDINLLPADSTESDQRKRSQFWDDGKAQAFHLAKLGRMTDASLQAIASNGNPDEPGEMNFPPFRDGATYATMLANQIKGQFKSPPWSGNTTAKGRSGDVEPEEFIRLAAQDELNRRKTAAPKTSGVTYRKTKSPDAPK